MIPILKPIGQQFTARVDYDLEAQEDQDLLTVLLSGQFSPFLLVPQNTYGQRNSNSTLSDSMPSSWNDRAASSTTPLLSKARRCDALG